MRTFSWCGRRSLSATRRRGPRDCLGDIPIAGEQAPEWTSQSSASGRPNRLCIGTWRILLPTVPAPALGDQQDGAPWFHTALRCAETAHAARSLSLHHQRAMCEPFGDEAHVRVCSCSPLREMILLRGHNEEPVTPDPTSGGLATPRAAEPGPRLAPGPGGAVIARRLPERPRCGCRRDPRSRTSAEPGPRRPSARWWSRRRSP